MFYPIFLNLEGKYVVIVGGGEVAERKTESLLDSGARIKLISPHVSPRLRSLGVSGAINIHERPYAHSDCLGAFLVISATNDPTVQEVVWKDAEKLGILVNTVDQPDWCNAIMPAVVRQGDLTVAISTAGRSPALAARLRERLARMLGPEYGRFLELLGRVRPQIQQQFRDISKRKDLHYRIVDSNVLSLLEANDDAGAQRRIKEIIEEFEGERVTP